LADISNANPPGGIKPGLKLRAEDAEDLQIVSSSLQDALVAVGDMTLLSDQRRFALVANRFRWEHAPTADGSYIRSHCILAIDGVSGAVMQGIDRHRAERVLSLLAIETQPRETGGSYVLLVFADQAAIRLEVDRVLCHLEDVGEPWPTRWKPVHSLE
jgi:hypothetical protein